MAPHGIETEAERRAWALLGLLGAPSGLAHALHALGIAGVVHGPLPGVLTCCIAGALAGSVAPSGLRPVAPAVWATVGAVILVTLYMVAAPTGHAALARLRQFNAGALALSLASTAAGVVAGQFVARCRSGRPAAAA